MDLGFYEERAKQGEASFLYPLSLSFFRPYPFCSPPASPSLSFSSLPLYPTPPSPPGKDPQIQLGGMGTPKNTLAEFGAPATFLWWCLEASIRVCWQLYKVGLCGPKCFNPLKRSGVRCLHFEVFIVIHLRRARLIMGWVTVSAWFNSWCRKIYLSI